MQDQELKQLKLKLSAGINVWISLFHYLKEENVNWAQTAEQRESELESLQRRYDDLVLEKEKVEDELRKVKQQADEMEQLFLQRSQSEGNEEYERRIQELEELVNTLETENRERSEEALSVPVNDPNSALLEQIKSLKKKVELLESEREDCESMNEM